MPLRRLLPSLIVTGILAACAQLPQTLTPDAVPTQRQAQRRAGEFYLSGRLAVTQREQRHAMSVTWQHGTMRDQIFLSTPLGQGIAELTRDGGGARLVTADRREFSAPDWQNLALQMFGFSLPLASLPRWLLADVPAEAMGVSYDRAGRPQHMVVEGWRIAYLDYAGDAADALPALIEMQHEEITVRLKIDQWQSVR